MMSTCQRGAPTLGIDASRKKRPRRSQVCADQPSDRYEKSACHRERCAADDPATWGWCALMAVAERRDFDGADPADGVATVLMAKRDVLLRVYRDRLPHEDLEDCLGQAALELVTRARTDGLQGERHIANALEQKFVSRIVDRQRALGRRPAMITTDAGDGDALGDGEDPPSFELVAPNGEPSRTAATRDELERLREVAAELTDDQRL